MIEGLEFLHCLNHLSLAETSFGESIGRRGQAIFWLWHTCWTWTSSIETACTKLHERSTRVASIKRRSKSLALSAWKHGYLRWTYQCDEIGGRDVYLSKQIEL